MSEPVLSDTPRDQENVSDYTGCLNLSNLTHQGTREMCRLYRMSEPVLSDTPRDQENVSDYTGCLNLSNLTHQGTREMCLIIQEVRTCLI